MIDQWNRTTGYKPDYSQYRKALSAKKKKDLRGVGHTDVVRIRILVAA